MKLLTTGEIAGAALDVFAQVGADNQGKLSIAGTG